MNTTRPPPKSGEGMARKRSRSNRKPNLRVRRKQASRLWTPTEKPLDIIGPRRKADN